MRMILKKIICIIFCFSLIVSSSTVTVRASERHLIGDVDDNNKISVRDALAILYHAASIGDGLPEDMLVYADTDRDGKITANDAYCILLYLCGYSVGFNTDNIDTNGTLWIASDSIAAGTGNRPIYGWGEVIGDYLTADAVVHNTAFSGESSKSFIKNASYKKIMDGIKAGDLLIICFGHNDTKEGVWFTDPFASSDTVDSYKYNLKNYYIDPAYRAGAQPVLMSSPARHYSDLYNEPIQYHYYYTVAAAELVEDYAAEGINLPFIDMFHLTLKQYQTLGASQARSLYFKDTIHFKENGARFGAQLILTMMKEYGWDYAKYINEDVLVDPRLY